MSVSVMEGGSMALDLPAKYQKLASEYAKIRAQFGVLKKAVIDEQSQTTELKEILRIRDQSLRKAEQELDSLNFRNQQLTKRVTILQDELDSAQSTSKSKLKGNSVKSEDSVIVEELQKKISENAHLISTLQEQTEKYENEKFKFNQKIEMYEHQIKEYQSSLSASENTKLTKHDAEMKQLMSKLNAKDDEIKKLSNEIKQLKSDLMRKSTALASTELNEKFSTLVRNLSIHELLTSLSQFFQQIEIRCKNNMEKDEFHKFEEINQKNRLMLQDFIDKYLLYNSIGIGEDVLIGSEVLCENIQQYSTILEELSKCLSCREDKEVIPTINQIICNFQKQWIQFNSILKNVQSLNSSSPSASEELVNSFTDIFRSFRSTCDYFLSAFNEKFKSHQINKESEKEILSILSRMSFQSSCIYRKLTENVSIFKQVLEIHIFKINQKAVVMQSKECCENWKQEIELMKLAHSEKIKELEDQISCLSKAAMPQSTNSSYMVLPPVNENQELNDTNQFDGTAPFDGSEVKAEPEHLKFFNSSMNKLVADLQFAQSKVTVFMEECEALQRRLQHSLESRLILEDSLKEAQSAISRLQEESQTTTINYEVQLQSMSEHMANMNEKLAAQEEEIEILRHELNEKFQGMKKGKSN